MPQDAPFNQEKAHRLLKTMMLIRAFEEASIEQYTTGQIRGFLHLYIGEEAVATGIIDQLEDCDYILATYREHGHALARGVSPRRIMAEMFGRRDGVCRGRGGSMHIFDRERHFLGGHAIVAGHLPLAVGLALGLKMQKKPGVVVCFLGEGAVAEGEFHESMNLAALWQVPVMFICENNLYAMGTALARSESQVNLGLKAQSYQVRSLSVDGMDVMAVHDAFARALRATRVLSEPFFLECRTYRFRAHSMFDPDLYRDPAEVALWKKRDPITLFQSELTRQGLLSEAELRILEAGVRQEVAQAVEFAKQSPIEPLEDLMQDLYAPRPLPRSPPIGQDGGTGT